MSFLDEMRKVSDDYDIEHSGRGDYDKKIEEWLKPIKSRIRAEIAGGAKQVSVDDWFCFSTWYNQPEYVEFDVHMGLVRAEIKWRLTAKMKDMLQCLKDAAAEEGIEITDYSFILGNGGGDDSRSYDRSRFFEDSGVLYISRNNCKPYMDSIRDPRQWRLYVDCSFRFSV